MTEQIQMKTLSQPLLSPPPPPSVSSPPPPRPPVVTAAPASARLTPTEQMAFKYGRANTQLINRVVKGITTDTSEQHWLTYAVNLLASGKTPQQIARKLSGNVPKETIETLINNPSINAFLAAKGVATGAGQLLAKNISQITPMKDDKITYDINKFYAPPQPHFSKHPLLPFTIVQYLLLLVGMWLSIMTLKAANNVSSTLEYTSSSCTPCYVQKKMKGFADTLIAFYVFAIVFFMVYASTRHFRQGTFQMIKRGANMLRRGMSVASPYTTAFKWFIKLAVIGSFIIITVMVFVDFFHKVVYGYNHMYDSSTTTAVPSSTSTSTNTVNGPYRWCIASFSFVLINILFFIGYIFMLLHFKMTVF